MLIHGGTSGIGVTAIQLAQSLRRHRLSPPPAARRSARPACELGADAAIDYRTQDFAAEIKALTGGKRVDVVLDMVGGAYFDRNLRSWRWMDGW